MNRLPISIGVLFIMGFLGFSGPLTALDVWTVNAK